LLFAGGEPAMVAVVGYEDEEMVKTEVSLRLGDSLILQAMARDHRSVVIADVREDERWIWVPGAEEVRAWIAVPLLARDEMIGALMIDSTQPGFYTEADAAIAQALANQAAVAIENARLYQAEQRGREIAEALQETARVVNTSLNLEEVLPLILEQLAQVIEYDSSAVLLLDNDRFKVTAGRGFPDLEAALRISFNADEDNLSSAVMHARRPLIIEDVQADPRWRPDPGVTHIHGWIGAPLIARDRVTGILNVDSCQTGAYSEKDGQLVFAFAAQAAIAIENARLFEEIQEHIVRLEKTTRDLELVHQVSQMVGSSLDLSRILETTAEQMVTMFEADHSGILLFDRAQTYGQVVAEYPSTGTVAERFPVQGYLAAERIIAGREPLVIEDAWNDPLMATVWEAMHRLDIRSMLIVPLIVKGEVVGSIGLDAVGRQRRFNAEEVTLAQTIASQAAIAIENARLYEQAQQEIAERKRTEETLERRATQLATVSEVGQQITSLLEPDPLLDHIVNLIREVFDYHYVSILLIDSATGELALRAGAGYELEPAKSLRLRVGQDGICGWVAASGEPLLVGDVSQERHYYQVGELPNTRSELAVPIQVKGQVIGVLDAQSAKLEGFDEDDLFIMHTLADQVAVALENAGLYQELHHYAEQLEQRVQERTAQLQAQYARQDAVLRSASDGIVVTDARGAILQTNPVAQAWLAQTLSPDDAAWLQEAVRDVAQRAKEQPETVLELTGLDLELRAAPILEPGTDEAAAVVAIHDVSHLKTLDRMKSRFISNVSHELRTPVTTIKLYTALLQQASPEKWGKYLETMEREAEQLACLVEDILQISHIDAGWMEIKPRPTSINELTETATVRHLALAQNQGLTLEHRPAEPGPVALVDPEQTMQVLNNLVMNAIQYTPEGGQIVVSTGKQETNGRVWTTVAVADTGIGIPEEELPRIFDRFFRGEEPRLMQVPGTGLGLAIAKSVVELHGGRLTVESQVGEGTTFTVWLPLA
ncbi:MAG: GAF domain-containing protein, partial [Anaerolineae bacterium]|nr:GAF domain-containing protein [Anaerolineae bacterium]